jgi:glycosyltransferase involved in cell wall biosynthesis
MRNQNIICFAKDWTEDPTSNNHVMRLLAKENQVLWLNSISTRTPDFSSGRDLQKIVRKLQSFAKGPSAIENGLRVYTPIVLPFPHSDMATTVNNQILNTTMKILRRRYSMNDFQLWSFIPTAVKYVGKLGESLVVYYCTDEWSQFSYVDSEKIVKMEKELCERADIVFTTARTLLERKKQYNPETHLASHGVDVAHFMKALAPETKVAPEIAGLTHPVIGFIGLVQDWVDVELFAYLAEKKPNWQIVIVGKALTDISILKKYSNIQLLGRKAYEDLPHYCKGFDVGIIPFRMNELTRNVNPIKLREYLSAGLPVVSSDMPEVRHAMDAAVAAGHRDFVHVATSHAEFLAMTERALAEDSPAARQRRANEMKAESWEKKVEALGEHIERVKAKKRARAY